MNEFIVMLESATYEKVEWNPGEYLGQKEYAMFDDGDAFVVRISCGVFLFTHGGAFIGHLDN